MSGQTLPSDSYVAWGQGVFLWVGLVTKGLRNQLEKAPTGQGGTIQTWIRKILAIDWYTSYMFKAMSNDALK